MEKEINNIYTGLIICYKSLNNGLRELNYLLQEKKVNYPNYYSDDDDNIFEMNLLDNIFFFYYNSWNQLKIKYYKDLLGLDYWIDNKLIKRHIIIDKPPNFIEITTLTKSIIRKLINTKKKENEMKLKKLLYYHKNLWFNYNNNLLDELVFNHVQINNSSIRYFNNLDSKLIKKKESDIIKYSRSRIIQKENNILKSEIDKLKKENNMLKLQKNKLKKINI